MISIFGDCTGKLERMDQLIKGKDNCNHVMNIRIANLNEMWFATSEAEGKEIFVGAFTVEAMASGLANALKMVADN